MLRISLCLLIAAAACAQTEIGNAGSVTLDSGVTINFRVVAEPPMPRSAFLPLGFGFRSDKDTMRFMICDDVSQSCFGYRLDVSSPDSAGARLATVGPVGPEGMGMSEAFEGKEFKQAPLPKYPAPQTVHDGDTFALDLMTSADGRARIVSYLHFDFGSKASDARDFTIDDGLAAFAFKPAGEALVNGAKPPGQTTFIDGHNRATVWLYLPGHGRYILSLAPHGGFVKAGVVRGNRLTFQADAEHIEVRLGQPLAGAEHTWNLYVFHDPRYTPPPGQEQLTIVSADRLENLLPKH